MKVTFIRPNMADGRSADALPPLAVAALCAHTPADVEVAFFDECVEELPPALETDLAALTVHTFAARRAYRIADRLRGRGVPVVMGGYHPTFLPEEALAHADSVVAGPADALWGQVLADFRAGGMRRVYRAERPPDAGDLRYDMRPFRGKKYNPLFPVEFSRGCRYRCEFCSVSAFNGFGHTRRPHERVIQDIERSGAKRMLFVDDNIFADRQEARRLFEALAPLRVAWGCQVSIDVARSPETLALMARAGCVVFMIGFESLVPENLAQMHKGSHVSDRSYGDAIRRIKDHGIMIYGSFVFGYDHDTEDVLDRTLDFAMEHKFVIANFNTLNPLPGTGLYHRLRTEGRLLDEAWWLKETYAYGEVMFVPRRMTPQRLKEACIRLRMEFSRPASVLRRALDPRANARRPGNLGLFLLANAVTRKEYKAKMKRVR